MAAGRLPHLYGFCLGESICHIEHTALLVGGQQPRLGPIIIVVRHAHYPITEEVRAMMSAQAQTRRTMSNALALLEDLMESIDGEQKERLSQTIAELEVIENTLEENEEEEVSLKDTPHNTNNLP